MPSPKSRVVTPDPPVVRGGNQTFEDVDTLRSSDGLKAVISQRRANGTFTFAIFREFQRDGKLQQGAFIPEELGQAYIDMTVRVLDRIVEIRKSGATPFMIR